VVLLTAWRFVRQCGSPEQAEAEACLDAVRLAVEWIRQPIFLESDRVSIVNALKSNDSSRSSWAETIAEIGAASELLPECRFAHTRREGNRVAHQLAQMAMRSCECGVMRFDMPPDVREVVQADAARIGRSNVPDVREVVQADAGRIGRSNVPCNLSIS
jgi:hypothetical protein